MVMINKTLSIHHRPIANQYDTYTFNAYTENVDPFDGHKNHRSISFTKSQSGHTYHYAITSSRNLAMSQINSFDLISSTSRRVVRHPLERCSIQSGRLISSVQRVNFYVSIYLLFYTESILDVYILIQVYIHVF